MDSDSASSRALTIERNQLARAARLRWFHWLIVGLSLLLTVVAWYFCARQVEARSSEMFAAERDRVVALMAERMRKYEDALWSGVAAINASGGDVPHPYWNAFSSSLAIERKYPGMHGIGVIRYVLERDLDAFAEQMQLAQPDYAVMPAHSRPQKLPVAYIEPLVSNRAALGLDVAYEQNRFEAAMRAGASGVAQITAPILLVQDENQMPGFLLFAPYYSDGQRPGTQDERLANFQGLVYAPFVVNQLVDGALGMDHRLVGIRLSDSGALLYDENHAEHIGYDVGAAYQEQVRIPMFGREWTFDIRSTSAFAALTDNRQPAMILVGGLIINALLLALFVMLSRANRGALEYADRLSVALREKAGELARSNTDLENFAYVASHDLKTPIRGIADLTEFLDDDLASFPGWPEAYPEVARNTSRIRQQAERMTNLVDGILSYSRVGRTPEGVSELDLREFITNKRAALGIPAEQLMLAGDTTHLVTFKMRLEQVLDNLIENAFKYHHDRPKAVVELSCVRCEQHYRFSVSDNGPGIDPKFHDRIFEVFQTLQSRDRVEASGVGLSIVKKSVESLGGAVRVSSRPGHGTVFEVDWPFGLSSEANVKAMVS